MCEALDVLHRNGLIHGDVNPGNLIVSGRDLVLTDYDFVSRIDEPITAPGAVLYCSPSQQTGRAASPSDDLYALAASFFHVMFEHEPFRYDGAVAKERGLNWETVDAEQRAQYPTVTAFLDRATHPDADRRFQSAAEALKALAVEPPISPPVVAPIPVISPPPIVAPVPTPPVGQPTPVQAPNPPVVRREERIEWLRWLLQSYPGSRWGNQETRGLDSDFAKQTYVGTRLEAALHDDLRTRRIRLVILCGNAGDGKTALLQHLAGQFDLERRASSERILKGETDDGLRVRMNLDGSASWQGRSADELLDEFLAPFRDGPPTEDVAHLLAINDGRLLEWIERVEGREGDTAPHAGTVRVASAGSAGSVDRRRCRRREGRGQRVLRRGRRRGRGRRRRRCPAVDPRCAHPVRQPQSAVLGRRRDGRRNGHRQRFPGTLGRQPVRRQPGVGDLGAVRKLFGAGPLRRVPGQSAVRTDRPPRERPGRGAVTRPRAALRGPPSRPPARRNARHGARAARRARLHSVRDALLQRLP